MYEHNLVLTKEALREFYFTEPHQNLDVKYSSCNELYRHTAGESQGMVSTNEPGNPTILHHMLCQLFY